MFRTALLFLATIVACSCTTDSNNTQPATDRAQPFNAISAGQFGLDEAEVAQIRREMQRAVDVGHISGALLWVGNGSDIGLLESVGTQTQESSTPVTTDTIFRIYSMTKPIISVAAMSLVESGQLGLDDPVSAYLPSFLGLQVIDSTTGDIRPANNTMTIRHLLTHQSGIVQQPFAMNTPLGPLYRDSFPDVLTRPDPDAVGASFMEAFNTISAQELAARIGQLPVLFEPGTAWHYGHSTDVLGAVLEVASGQTLDDLLEDRIFGPLSMEDTSFWVDEKDASRVAEPIFGPMTDNTQIRRMLAGGHGLNSTAEDYARFALMLLNGGALDGTRILSASGLDLMREGTLGPGVSRQYFFYGDIGDWGLGFHLQPTTDDPDGPHSFGWRGIGGTLFLVDEENDFYLIYMVQKWGGPDDTPFTNDIAARMFYEAMRN
ncbi:MAG: serine hydrolase domain-containing protein [Pseudohongiellaceae bacterium]